MKTPFTITEVQTKFAKNSENWNPFVFASNGPTSFEWGAYCNKENLPVANFPVLKVGGTFPDTSYLTIATQQAQYNLFWNDGANPGEATILLQDLTTDTPYPKNQTALWSGSTSGALTFTLVIDQTSNTISLSQNS